MDSRSLIGERAGIGVGHGLRIGVDLRKEEQGDGDGGGEEEGGGASEDGESQEKGEAQEKGASHAKGSWRESEKMLTGRDSRTRDRWRTGRGPPREEVGNAFANDPRRGNEATIKAPASSTLHVGQ